MIENRKTPYLKKIEAIPVSRGRPVLPVKKVSTTIRLYTEILEKFPGSMSRWQSSINDALKVWLAWTKNSTPSPCLR